MAKDASFDIVSKVDMQEVDNAINQTNKEISQRYDFKNSKSTVAIEDGDIKVVADDDYKLRSVIDILQSKLIRRKVAIKNLEYGKVETAGGGLLRQIIKVKQGIESEKGKEIIKDIKNSKIKVQPQYLENQIRVSGKSRDDLQAVIQLLKDKDYGVELQFTNYR
ncbi:MAG: YajQ family cyclic di-GMP-binding protein [Clostridia bacterium]|jgi:uncharacterized protein YajQ (UPF0234 family)|nr:YajQ family cyclic di-GMP-binding protein [Clostridia bacterium]